MAIFQHDFMIYALAIGLLLAIAGAFLSPFLVLSNQAMIADGISHVAFTGVIIGYLFSGQPLIIAIPFVVVMSVAITFLIDKIKVNSDAAISVVASFSLAVGLIIATVGSGYNRSIESLLVGSILTVNFSEFVLALILVVIVVLFVLKYYRQLLLIIYDNEFAQTSHINARLLKYVLNIITSLFVVIGVRTVGTLLISALTVFPTLISVRLSKSFKTTVMYAVIVSIITTIFGVIASYYLGFPTGSTIVVLYMFALLVAFAMSKKRRVKLYENDKA